MPAVEKANKQYKKQKTKSKKWKNIKQLEKQKSWKSINKLDKTKIKQNFCMKNNADGKFKRQWYKKQQQSETVVKA